MTKRGRIVEEITAEKMERRWQKLHGWPQALHDAYRHDTTKLSAYLRRRDLDDLDQSKREQLADLIDRHIHHRGGKRGRKPGRIPPRDPDAITDEEIAARARAEMRQMKRRNGGRTLRGAVPKAINTVCQLFADDGYPLSGINMDRVVKLLRR
jgi:hypothetical protein